MLCAGLQAGGGFYAYEPPVRVAFYFGMVFMLRGIEQFKCNSPVDCCSIPARRDRHLYFLPHQGEKMQIDSLSSCHP